MSLLNTKNLRIVALALVAGTLSSCAHLHRDADKPETRTVTHSVSISSPEIEVGEKLDILKDVCKSRTAHFKGGTRDVMTCRHEKVGEATVVRVIDEKTSSVELDPGVEFNPSYKFEKKESK